MVIGEVCRASAAGRHKRDGICPIACRCAGVCIGRRSGDCPLLIISADALILNDNGFSLSEKRQENVDIFAVVRQMADVDTSRANLCGVVPQNMPIARIT